MTCKEARDLLRDPGVRQGFGPGGDRCFRGHSPYRLQDLREHVSGCQHCSRRLAADRAIGIILDYRTPTTAETDLAPGVLNAIGIRRAARSQNPLGRRWALLPLEWRAVPVAAGLCAGLVIGWLASKDSRDPDYWLAGFEEDSVEQRLVTSLIPAEPWGGEPQ